MGKLEGADAVRYLREHSDTILVVDSAPISRSNLRRNLEYYGFTVAEAADAAQALASFGDRKMRIGLVLLDVTTIGGEAKALVAQTLKADPSTRILLCTDKAPSAVRMTEQKSGIVGMLRKPVSTERLLRAVSKALGI